MSQSNHFVTSQFEPLQAFVGCLAKSHDNQTDRAQERNNVVSNHHKAITSLSEQVLKLHSVAEIHSKVQLQQDDAIAQLDNEFQHSMALIILQQDNSIRHIRSKLANTTEKLVGTLHKCSKSISTVQNSIDALELQTGGLTAQLADTTTLFN